MSVRASRVVVGVVAWTAIALAAALALTQERRASEARAAFRAFDQRAREAADLVAELAEAQQAYVAAGQGVAFWMPKVASTLGAATSAIESLQHSATSAAAGSALDAAATALGQAGEVDRRARGYLQSNQPLMAADVIFTESVQTMQEARRQIEAARTAEQQAVDGSAAAGRKQAALAAAGAGGFAALVVALLVPTRRRTDGAAGDGQPAGATVPADSAPPPAPGGADLIAKLSVPAAITGATSPAGLNWMRAAQLCTELGRIRDLDRLNAILSGAADLMEASGLVVWLGSAAGDDLRPVLAHGYSPQTLARMASVPRAANNAAATAYRTSKMQIVLSHPGSSGALVAPLLTSDGCIGALTAEIRGGSEGSEGVQALATILAAQLAGAVAAPGTTVGLGAASAGA